MQRVQGTEYNVDLVLCIDATSSMAPFIDRVKTNALEFDDVIRQAFEKVHESVGSLRVRVVVFRDYYFDGQHAIQESGFFTLPEKRESFADFINSIRAEGGGDAPENGLEALTLAMNSDWHTEGNKRRRQNIVIWTDASAHPLDKNSGSKPANYPQDMPADFDEITDLWDGQYSMNPSAKRLIMFAPDAEPWTQISNHWTKTIQLTVRAGEGLADVDYRTIIDIITHDI